MKKFAIDLTWVRQGIVGGTEAYIRNLLDGIAQTGRTDFVAVLLLAQDNYDAFRKYGAYTCYRLIKCGTQARSRWKRVIWQNVRMGRLLRRLQTDTCFEPVYGKPFAGGRGIRYYTTIHDLQALHYPQYFSTFRKIWMRISWWNTVKTSEKIFAISDYVKQEITKHYRMDPDRIIVIYNAVCLSSDRECSKDVLKQYGIKTKQYYYTVSSLLPHKNLRTLVMAMSVLKEKKQEFFFPLLVSGVGGKKEKKKLDALIREKKLEKDIIFTNYISNEDRNELYRNCKAFLFASVYEGFGMPPVEALVSGALVITTDRASIREVTAGLALYVKDPYDPEEWAEMISREEPLPQKAAVERLPDRYQAQKIAAQYIRILVDGDYENE